MYWGIGVKLNTEIQINRNLTFSSSIAQKFADTFDDKRSNPDSRMEKVRTEILDYLQRSDKPHIKYMQIDYINSYKDNAYIGAGYMKNVWGLSSEFLYKPFSSNFAISK